MMTEVKRLLHNIFIAVGFGTMVYVPMLLLDKGLNDIMKTVLITIPIFIGVYVFLYLFMKYIGDAADDKAS